MLKARTLSVLVGLAVLIGGCSTQTGSETGRPSAAEYRSAIEATAACIADAGFTVGPLQYASDGRELQIPITVQAGAEEDVERVYRECEEEHSAQISALYLDGRHLTGAEREEAMGDLVTCLEKVGVEGLSAAETDSRVFIRAIMADGVDAPHVGPAMACFNRYRDVWPPGDTNNP